MRHHCIHNRLLWLSAIGVILAVALIGRLVQLQWIEHTTWQQLAWHNQHRTIPLLPARGIIFDRHGVILADNQPVYVLTTTLTTSQLKPLLKRYPWLQPVGSWPALFQQLVPDVHWLKIGLTSQELAQWTLDGADWSPAIQLEVHFLRHYPEGANCSEVIGYVGRSTTVPTEQWFEGKTGIERSQEKRLCGQVGSAIWTKDATGKRQTYIQRILPVPGQSLQLTLDASLQATIKHWMVDDGAVIVVHIPSGEIRVLASKPSYNPNSFITGMTRQQYHALQNDPNQPLYNRALMGHYPPGSVIKPMLLLAGLLSHAVTPVTTIDDPGWFKLPNSSHVYRDHHTHGRVAAVKAIASSCDVYFYQLGLKLGIHAMADIARTMGFGQTVLNGVLTENTGLIPTPLWKKQHEHQPWRLSDTVISSIGQGYWLVTPIQLANMITQLAVLPKSAHTLHIIKAWFNHHTKRWEAVTIPTMSVLPNVTSAAKIVQQGMLMATQPGGTLYHAFNHAAYHVSGKSGTVQVFSTRGVKEDVAERLPYHLRDHAWFVGYAPSEQPTWAVVVLTEHAHNAAPLARRIMDYLMHV
jgi:penicillin-binding protein 2